MRPLLRLRLQLTAWYVGTFAVILLVLGSGLFTVVSRQLARQLDASLRAATAEVARAAEIRDQESRAVGQVADAVTELRIPDRSLYLLDTAGAPVSPAQADAWVRESAQRAAVEGALDARHHFRGAAERSLQLHAERFTLHDGRPFVAVAVADRVELEDRYAALIAAFGAAAFLALLMVALGGYFLGQKATAPVERTMDQMRRFMADAAHELRTPVTVLRSQAEVALQRERDPATYRAALEATAHEAERIGGILGNLLTLARADALEWPLRRERLYLDDLVPDAANAARLLADPARVQVEVASLDEAPVVGDPALLRQLLLILLDNAVKYTPAGRIAIGVTRTNGQSTVLVQDTGVGIAEDQLPRVFDRFFRGDPARARSEGAGLGLAIARWIADTHGATIDVVSRLGVGTGVTVRFPE